jgi:hypothetical protein
VKAAGEYAERDVVMLAVSYDDTDEDIVSFMEENGYDFLTLRDDREKGLTGPLYQVGPIPTLLLIDSQGKITYRHVGYSPGDEDELRTKIEEALASPQA